MKNSEVTTPLPLRVGPARLFNVSPIHLPVPVDSAEHLSRRLGTCARGAFVRLWDSRAHWHERQAKCGSRYSPRSLAPANHWSKGECMRTRDPAPGLRLPCPSEHRRTGRRTSSLSPVCFSEVVRGAKAPLSVEKLVKVHLVYGVQLPAHIICHEEEVLRLCLVPVQVAVQSRGQQGIVGSERVVVRQGRAVEGVLELPDAGR